MDAQRQLLLMRAAGVAVEMLMQNVVKKAGDDAILFTPAPNVAEERSDMATPTLLSEENKIQEVDAYTQAWRQVNIALKELDAAMRHHLDSSIAVRNFLVGSHPTPEQIQTIDRMFREQGYLLPDPVI